MQSVGMLCVVKLSVVAQSFHPCLTTISKAVAYQNGATIWGLTRKPQTRTKRLFTIKHSSSFVGKIGDEQNIFFYYEHLGPNVINFFTSVIYKCS
jgi:hypothetical protein